jgi:Rps23 Pro-64 3,4-dihydroxylase Tpa1-like proline 4-hydroxylase
MNDTHHFFNRAYWQQHLPQWRKQYQTSDPFPHLVIDNLFDATGLEKVMNEFPPVTDEGWIHYIHYNEKKHGLNKTELIPDCNRRFIQTLNSIEFMKFLETLTGIENLRADESLEGGGLHQSVKGGFLNIHADFTVHPHKKNWRRRVNVLVYLNKDWKEEYNGHLELWQRDMKKCSVKVLPLFNRCVIFNTDHDSFHGVPEPIQCPEGVSRKSIALYYFTEEKFIPKKVHTNYQPKPDEKIWKRVLIYLDRQILWTYSNIKSLLGLNDDFASNILKRLGQKKK